MRRPDSSAAHPRHVPFGVWSLKKRVARAQSGSKDVRFTGDERVFALLKRHPMQFEGDGPAIVLLHGFPLAREVWDAQAHALSKRARVIRYDIRGLGKAKATPGPYMMESLASDLCDVLDSLSIERATIVGHSLGGYIAFAFFRLFTERCAGLGLVCTRAIADDAATARARHALADRTEREGMGPIIDAYLPKYFAPDVYRRRPELVERARAIFAATDPVGAAAVLRGMAERVAADDLFEEIHIPVRVVLGLRDALAPIELSEQIAAGIVGAKIDRLDCGHFPLYEDAEALTASLAGLLDEV